MNDYNTLIRNSNQVKQAIDFTGVENGAIHPTDIDAVLEFDNEAIIFIEVKKEGNAIPTGQRLVLERLVEAWRTPKAIALFVTHPGTDETQDIPLKECTVIKYYSQQTKWQLMKKSPLKNILNFLGKEWGINKLKI